MLRVKWAKQQFTADGWKTFDELVAVVRRITGVLQPKLMFKGKLLTAASLHTVPPGELIVAIGSAGVFSEPVVINQPVSKSASSKSIAHVSNPRVSAGSVSGARSIGTEAVDKSQASKYQEEQRIRRSICRPEYLQEFQVLTNTHKVNLDGQPFQSQVSQLLKCIAFLNKWYPRNPADVMPHPFVVDAGASLRTWKAIVLAIISPPGSTPHPQLLQMVRDENYVRLQMRAWQDDTYFDDAKTIVRCIFSAMYYFPRADRARLVGLFPESWGVDAWFLMEFATAAFTEDESVVNDEGGIVYHYTPFDFGYHSAASASEKQAAINKISYFGDFQRAVNMNLCLVKVAMVDILPEISLIERFFKHVLACLQSNRNPSQRLHPLPKLHTLIFYQKRLSNLRRQLTFLPVGPGQQPARISAVYQAAYETGLRDQEVMQFLVNPMFNTATKIDLMPYLRRRFGVLAREKAQEVATYCNMKGISFTPNQCPVELLIELGLQNESMPSYGVSPPNRVSAVDFLSSKLHSVTTRLQCAAATNYFDLRTLRGRLSILRELELVGEMFCLRNWGPSLDAVVWADPATLYRGLRTGLAHPCDYEVIAARVLLLEEDHGRLASLFRELQAMREFLYEELASRQSKFARFPATDLFDAQDGFATWGTPTRDYWNSILQQSTSETRADVDLRACLSGSPALSPDERATLLAAIKPEHREQLELQLDGDEKLPARSPKEMSDMMNTKVDSRAMHRLYNQARTAITVQTKLVNDARKAAIDAAKPASDAREVERSLAMRRNFPQIRSLVLHLQEGQAGGKLADRVKVCRLLQERSARLQKLLEECIALETTDQLGSLNAGRLLQVVTEVLARPSVSWSCSYLVGQVLDGWSLLAGLTDVTVVNANLPKRIPAFRILRNALEHVDPVLESARLPYFEMTNDVVNIRALADVIVELNALHAQLMACDPSALIDQKDPTAKQEHQLRPEAFMQYLQVAQKSSVQRSLEGSDWVAREAAAGVISSASLNVEAARYGLRCEDVPGDGNCFFHAVAAARNAARAPGVAVVTGIELRALMLQHLLDHVGDYARFMYQSPHAFIGTLLDGEWADHLVIKAMARALDCTIVLLRSDGQEPTVVNKAAVEPRPIVLLGYIVGLHFQHAVVDVAVVPAVLIQDVINAAVGDL